MKRKLKIFMLSAMAILMAASISSCKYKGFKKDRKTGIYYKFYGEINDTAKMPVTGDLVGFILTLHADDSILIPTMPNEILMDSLYNGDIFSAIRMMHVGDSATFILDGKQFYETMMKTPDYPFGKKPLYADMKLYGRMSHEQYLELKAEYDKMMAVKAAAEDSLILDYVKTHRITVSPTEEGIYYMPSQKGTGAQPQIMDKVEVHYTGKLLDGTVFDSSVNRGEPFSFRLGAHEVIPGWEKAVAMMHVGEKATFLIPSQLAYGERGTYGIPPYTPLIFEIELLKIVEQE